MKIPRLPALLLLWGNVAPIHAAVHDGSLADLNICYVGRWDHRDAAVAHSYWSNAYLRTIFTGPTVQVKVAAQENVVVSIDGEPARTLRGNGLINLTPSPLSGVEHTLVLSSDSQNGELYFQGLVLAAGSTTKLPPARPLIEFIGDSITACQAKGGKATDNYAWLTGEALGCDHTQIAFSGKGLRSGWGALEDKTGFDSHYFRLMNCNHPETDLWDFSIYTPRVIVINHGTNEVRNGRRETDTEFIVTYKSFVRAVREKLPTAEIVALRPFSGFLEGGIRQAVADLNAAGDTHVHYVDTASWLNIDAKTGKVDAEDSSDGLHPSVQGHAKVARLLAEALRPILALPLREAPAPAEIGHPEHPEALFGEIVAASQKNAKANAIPNVVRVRPGTYVVPENAAEWNFSGANTLKDCTVELGGVTLVFKGPSKAFALFTGCENATFRGAVMAHEVPSSSQGTVIRINRVDAAHWSFDLRIDAGYLSQLSDLRPHPTAHVFEGTAKDAQGKPPWKTGGGYFHPDSMQPTGEAGVLRLLMAGNVLPSELAVGDRIDLRGAAPFSVVVKNCANMIFQDLTLGSSGLYGIVEFDGNNNRYERCSITYGPKPPGASEAPIAATGADGFHSLGSTLGPTLLNCLIEGTPDDAIAIHGRYAAITEVPTNNVVVVQGNHAAASFDPGDEMRIQDERSGFYLQSKVNAAERVAGGDSRTETWKYTLDGAPGVNAGFLVSNPKRCGPDYTIINSVVRRNRARGMLLKADDGVINGNLVEDSTIAGIVLSPEGSQNEAGYVHTATISRNTIRHTGYSENGPGCAYAAGLTVTGDGGMGNRNITISGNVFDRVLGPNLIVRYTDTARIEANRFENTHQVACDNGAKVGIDPHAVIWIGNCRNVTLSGNIASKVGPFERSLLTVDEKTVQGIEGSKDGLTLKKQ